MGEVHEAWDTLLDRKVALKSLTAPSPAAILRFLREARLQARVSHPNVCRIYDVDASGEVPFIAMQLVQGPNLLQAAPGLAVAEAVAILQAVALAIHAAHRLHLIHRDIKPSNILLEPDGQGGWSAYVADFGLAKELGQGPVTETRVPMGTPEYMAPEQRRGDPGTLGPAIDVYALGATLEVVVELAVLGTANGRAGAPVRGERPGALRRIAARCLEERPQDRYRSAGELAEDLRRYLDHEPLLAERNDWRRGLGRTFRARPVLVLGAGLVLALGGGFGGWFGHLAARERHRAALAQRFALDARDLETRMRIERLLPVHDLGPAQAELLGRLAGIRRDLAGQGDLAQGPGNLALGQGYLALGELDRALEALEAARRSGYAPAEVALALGQVHCASCVRLDEDARPGGWEQSLASRREAHLREAQALFRQAAGATGEARDLGEAALLVQEGAFAPALAKARRVFRAEPWRYEALVEETRALAGLGRERALRGDAQAAASLFQEGALAVQAAEAIGPSDGATYLADLDLRILRLDRQGPVPGPAAWEPLEHLADRALAVDPDDARARSAKVYVLLRHAGALVRAGRDPEPALARAERFLEPWVAAPELRAAAALRRRWIQVLRAEYRMARGLGPGPGLDWALEERHGGIWTLEALVLQARWQARRGRSPDPWLRAFWAEDESGLPEADRPRLDQLRDQARRLAGAGPAGTGGEPPGVPR
jgi:serine/threonine-protein kinase